MRPKSKQSILLRTGFLSKLAPSLALTVHRKAMQSVDNLALVESEEVVAAEIFHEWPTMRESVVRTKIIQNA